MFSRLTQVSRHLARPATAAVGASTIPSSSQTSLSLPLRTGAAAMASSTPLQRQKATQIDRVHTAGCIIIGDEVLGGKLKRIEVIADDESEIVETVRRMSNDYDMVVTSGGIGPTHDDITYQSIAKAFDLPLVLHDEAFRLMKKLSAASKDTNFDWDTPSAQLEAKLRMVKLPIDKSRPDEDQVVFTNKEKLWVPVAVVNGNVHILPGVPRLFTQLIDGLKPQFLSRVSDPEGNGMYRLVIATPKSESSITAYLNELAAKVEPKGVKVGSYPRWGKKNNTVQLVGRDREYIDSLISEIEKNVEGKKVGSVENVDDLE